MRANLVIPWRVTARPRRGWGLSLAAVVLAFAASHATAQDDIATATNSNTWQRYDWLAPAEQQQRQAAAGESFHASMTQDIGDPFAVLTSGSLWQEKHNLVYTRQLGDGLSLSSESDSVALDDSTDDFSTSQKVGLQFQPVQAFTLKADLYDSTSDQPMPSASSETSGASFSAETHLPLDAVLIVGADSEKMTLDSSSPLYNTQTNSYDLQLTKPVGKLPLSAVVKGHYEGTSTGGAAPTSLPSLEQSLVWKPMDSTTIQAGLRQQQYQEYPGVDHELNEALFADWSQKLLDNVSWHSYAEVLNSRGLLDQAPASPIATGANGTPQATTPASTTSPTSSLPISIDDQTLTFSTGPSFQLQRDISASVEYSNRWDKNPAPGNVGQEQRVSVSLKGTF